MSILRVPAVMAAVLFMSSVSAQAMEFADRPGVTFDVVGASSATRAMLTDDCSRRQINTYSILLPVAIAETKPADRPRPVSLIQIRVTRMILSDRPGR